MRSKKLTRQFKKYFGTEDVEQKLNEFSLWFKAQKRPPEQLKDLPEFFEMFRLFFDAIDDVYSKNDRLLEIANRSLEVSSKELTESNKNLAMLNQSMTAMMNSLGQGFFVFDRYGICSQIYSKACLELLEDVPSGKNVIDVLRIKEQNQTEFLQWVKLLFEETIDFEDLAELGPSTFPHSKWKVIALEFKPMRSIENTIVGVVVVATDRTKEQQAKLEANLKQNYADMVIKLAKDRNQFIHFIKKAKEMFAALKSYTQESNLSLQELKKFRRILHTIKGGAASFSMVHIRDLVHELEDQVPSQKKDITNWLKSLPQAIEKLESELNAFLREHRNLLGREVENGEYVREVALKDLHDFLLNLENSHDLNALKQSFLETIIAVPIGELFRPFDTVLKNLADRRLKQVKPIEIIGGEHRVLSERYHEVFAAFIHIFNNAIDHGIEHPEERIVAGKDPQGLIRIMVNVIHSEGAQSKLQIVIGDDGQGINPIQIRTVLKGRGYPETVLNQDDESLIQHIFDQGFSTTREITDSSGRGVGLDALRAVVEQMDGSVRVKTSEHGTKFVIQLPYLWSVKETDFEETYEPLAYIRSGH